MISKTKTASFHDSIRILFWFFYFILTAKPKRQVSVTWKDICFFSSCLIYGFETGIFWDIIKTVSYSFTFWMASKTYGFKNLCFSFLFMVLISIREVSITWQVVCSYSSQNCFRTMSDLSKTLTSHPEDMLMAALKVKSCP